MKKHWEYLKYVMRHKWYVLLACWRWGMIWQGISHDMSKFLPSEWFPYAEFFYGNTPEEKKGLIKKRFKDAWFWHVKRNPHHWNFWIRPKGKSGFVPMEMPDKYVAEMVCDWIGAGKAQGSADAREWYRKNGEQMVLHPKTRLLVEGFLAEMLSEE